MTASSVVRRFGNVGAVSRPDSASLLRRFVVPATGRRVAVATWLVAALVFVVARLPSTDGANQRFRSFLFRDVAMVPWNNQWFGGHHTPAYSLIGPPISAILGGMVTGMIAALVTAVVCDELVGTALQLDPTSRRRRAAAAAAALTAAAPMFIGQTAYSLGVVFGCLTVVAVLRDRPFVAVGTALLCAAASPAAGLFLGLSCGALVMANHRRIVALVAATTSAVTFLLIAWLFPEGGSYFPYSWLGALNLALLLAVIAGAGYRYRVVWWGVIGYVVLGIATLVGTTGMGNIVARFAGLAAAPMVVATARWRTWLVAVAATGLVCYQWAPVSGIALADVGAVREAADYDGMLAAIDDIQRQSAQVVVVEVVPVRTHDEADFVARRFPIARGWHRHLDRRDNMLFYEGQLSDDEYRAWLVEHGVSVVAIADVKLDYGGTREHGVLLTPPDYLSLVYQDDVWRVFVVDPQPRLATGSATLSAMTPDTFTLDFTEAGSSTVKVKFSPWFVVDGAACVTEGEGGWTVVEATDPGPVTVRATLSIGAIVDRNGSCGG